MTTLDSPCQLNTLAISPTLHDFLTDQLIELPFGGDRSAADAMWLSTGTQLHYLSHDDRLSDVPDIDRVKRFHLIHLHEILLSTPDHHVLLLSVTQDDGGGTYLLFPKASCCCALAALGRQAHD